MKSNKPIEDIGKQLPLLRASSLTAVTQHHLKIEAELNRLIMRNPDVEADEIRRRVDEAAITGAISYIDAIHYVDNLIAEGRFIVHERQTYFAAETELVRSLRELKNQMLAPLVPLVERLARWLERIQR